MHVVIPYTQIHRYTSEAAPADADWRYVGGDKHAYWRLMCELWEEGETFAVVEHDVAIHGDVLSQFEACGEPWCVFPYDSICHWECMEAWANMLGCTRFDASLIAAVPDAVSSITKPEHLDWHNLCDGIAGNLRTAGFTHHWHFPPIRHHRGVQSPELEDDQTIAVDWAKVMAEHG